MIAPVVGNSIRLRPVLRIVGSGVVEGARPGVVSHHLQTVGESLLHFDLEAVVAVAGIAAVIAQVLAPAELLEVRFPLVGGKRPEADDGGLIRVVIAARAREDVSTVISDVSSFQ